MPGVFFHVSPGKRALFFLPESLAFRFYIQIKKGYLQNMLASVSFVISPVVSILFLFVFLVFFRFILFKKRQQSFHKRTGGTKRYYYEYHHKGDYDIVVSGGAFYYRKQIHNGPEPTYECENEVKNQQNYFVFHHR